MPPRSLAEFDAAMTPGAQGRPQAPMPSVDKPAIPIGIPGVEDVVNLPSNLVKGAKALPDVLRNFFTHPKETAKGFVQGASEAATPGRTGLLALLTGGANLPATLAAAGAQAGVEGTRVATDAPNAPRSFGDAALDTAGAASIPGLAAAEGPLLAKAGGAARLIKRGVGGVLGAYEGNKYGGIPGAIVGGIGGAAVGGGDVRLPGRLAPLSDFLAGDSAATETPAAVGDRYMPNRGNAPRPAVDLSGTVTPTKGVEDVLNDLGGYRSDINSGLSPELAAKLNGRGNSLASLKKVATPDLMDEFQSASDTGVGSGKQEFDMDGVHYAPDESGSHVAQVAAPDPMEADIPDFTFEGQNLNGEPPAFGSGPEGYSPRIVTPIADALPGQGGIDPEALDRLRRAIDPKIMQDWYEKNPGGMRTNRMSSTP